jgi:hypothetical protein
LKKEKAAYHAASFKKGGSNNSMPSIQGGSRDNSMAGGTKQQSKGGSVQLKFHVGAPTTNTDWQGVRTKGKAKGVRGPKHQIPLAGVYCIETVSPAASWHTCPD